MRKKWWLVAVGGILFVAAAWLGGAWLWRAFLALHGHHE